MKNSIVLILIFVTSIIYSQETEDAWLFFRDKPKAALFMANPLTMLSQRALDRRARQSILIDEQDVPIDETYLNEIKNIEEITILAKSKWLNAVHIQGTTAVINDVFSNFSFIKRVEYANTNLSDLQQKTTVTLTNNHQQKFQGTTTDFNYGETTNQVEMLQVDFLHREGFTGEGMQIAIIDAGFPNVNTLASFARLRAHNQILGGYNFADRNTDFYTRNSHGTHVLSTIGGYIENEFVGTAPDAKFYLFISEISETETVLEETLWIEAAERADSLGVDLINTSLEYTTFDNSDHNHSYADMDGETTIISRGAEIGASRGIIMVNAAGNSGTRSWKYLGAPSDAPAVFSVGAVTASRNIASFSSFGPTSDNRIKPDVLAQGEATSILNYATGNVTTSNGTSFSSPIMAGAMACFWQAFPTKKSSEIMDLIRESADRFTNPTAQEGYGIPNFERAYSSVLSVEKTPKELFISIAPNPANNSFKIQSDLCNDEECQLQIYTLLGVRVADKTIVSSEDIDISSLKKGIYLIKISNQNQHKNSKLIKNE
jgi:hypothetical protein